MTDVPNNEEIPLPADSDERARWLETARRRRMLNGTWESDLNTRVLEHVGAERFAGWGRKDMSANPFRVIARQLSVLYLSTPTVLNDDDPSELVAMVDDAGLWPTMSRFQSMVIGCREYLMRVHVDEDGAHYRAVPPDMTHCFSTVTEPSTMRRIEELRRRVYKGQEVWTWDVLDVLNPDEPIYQVRLHDAKGAGKHLGRDISAEVLGGDFSGENYPYRKADGTPILPYVLYHAEQLSDRLWDSFELSETVDGSLNLATGYSLWFHAFKDASWPQRYMFNAEVAGVSLQDGVNSAVADPAVITSLAVKDEGAGQAIIGQWKAGADVEVLERALRAYANRLAVDAGMPAGDVQRLNSARSGVAISLSNEGKREAQKRAKPHFELADAELMATTAILANRNNGTSLPESGYRIVYASLPLSPEELRSRREDVTDLLERGLISRTDAFLRLNPGMTVEDAQRKLTAISSERLA